MSDPHYTDAQIDDWLGTQLPTPGARAIVVQLRAERDNARKEIEWLKEQNLNNVAAYTAEIAELKSIIASREVTVKFPRPGEVLPRGKPDLPPEGEWE